MLTVGVRQGDSLNPTRFNIFINPLTIELTSLDIGIGINGRNVSSLLYADDLFVLRIGYRNKPSNTAR